MHSINNVDLLSLDVEGNELAILEGCSLEKGHIKNILVETSDYKTINDYLINSGYFLIKKLSGHDYLYSLKNPLKIPKKFWKLTKTSTQSYVMCAFSC